MEFLRGEQSIRKPTIQELQPGGMSMAGFLEKDQSLEQVLERDRNALELLGYTAQEVADLLGYVTERAVRGGNFDYTAPNGKHYEVVVRSYRGTQECPFHDTVDWKRSSGALDMHFTEKGKDGEPVRVAGLVRHLVEAHEFFEGGSYRVAPEKIVEMFGVEKVPGSLLQAKELKF